MTAFSREEIFAGMGIAVSLIRYATYLWSIYKKETRPHVFSWFNWGLAVSIAAMAQSQVGGGPSVWILYLVASTCFLISFLALFVGEKNITRSDWLAFFGALISLVAWYVTSSPLAALLFLFSLYPTARKSWNDPGSEPVGSWVWSGSRYFFALFAVPNATLSSLVYPFFLMLSDWGFALYIFMRRRILDNTKE